MPRSARHKSSHLHKHVSGRDRSDSEDDMISKEKKPRAEEPAAFSGGRGSRDVEPEKRKPSTSCTQAPQGKEVIGASNGDVSGEHVKKRKGRLDDSFVSDRWTGGNEEEHIVDKKPKGEAFEPADTVKATKSNASALDTKGRSSRKGEDSSERNGESGSRVELVKRKSEKDLSRRESGSSQYKAEKDRDIDYAKDAKEKGGDYLKDAKERVRDYMKVGKEREKEYYKDAKDREKDRVKYTEERDRDQLKDAKERERDYPKDAKERDREHCRDAKERGKEDSKDAKEKGRVYSKDEKERDRDYPKDAKERRRDYPKDAKEADREYPKDTKERDRDQYKYAKEREREYYKDVKERERDYSKDTKDKERNYGKDAKERERDRGSLQDKNVQDARHEMSDDTGRRKQVSKISSSREEHVFKDMEIADGKMQDDPCNPDLEKVIDKHSRKRDSFGDVRDSDEKQLSSRDDNTKNGSYRDQRHREDRSREKYRDDLEREKRFRDDRRDEHLSRDQNSNRSDSKHLRDDNSTSESRYKKSKIQNNHHDGHSFVDDHGNNLKDNRAGKKFSDEIDYHIDMKPRNAKESYEESEKHASSAKQFNIHSDRSRLDYINVDKIDSSLSSNRHNCSPGSNNHALKEQNRPSSKQARSSCNKSEEAFHSSTNSKGDHASVPRNHDRVSESRSLEKRKSPPTSDRRLSDRTADRTSAKRSLDVERQKIISCKDGRALSNIRERERTMPFDKSVSGDHFHAQIPKNEPGSSSFNRSGHFSGSLSSHPLPPPPVRHGIDTSSGLVSYEDDCKVGDRKPNNRYKRNSDPSIARGQGSAWKNAPTWPSPITNGFIPLHHGPPHSGFHAAVQFAAPPLFGVRPSMDMSHMNHTGASFHVHETPERFSGHVRPFGWHNPINDCPPHMQLWDGNDGAFGDESHVYGRSEWDMHKCLIGGREWEMRADMWKGQNGNMEISGPRESEHSTHAFPDEPWSGKFDPNERAQSEQPFVDNSETKGLNAKSPVKVVETPQICIYEKTPESAKISSVPQTNEAPSNNDVYNCCHYLSKLDISLDLASSEVFNQCASLLGTGNKLNIHSVGSVAKHEQPKNNKKEATMTAKGRYHILSSLFPTKTDAVFQRTTSLYKKLSERRKATSICLPERDSPEVSEAEKLNDIDNQIRSTDVLMTENDIDNQMRSTDVLMAEKLKSASYQTSADASLANADSASNMEEERQTTDVVGYHPGDCKEQQFDSNSADVHFVEGSQSCEALLPECRESLSRILLSPGSTH